MIYEKEARNINSNSRCRGNHWHSCFSTFAFNMVSTGYHENRGLNAAVIDGSVSFIKTNSLIGSSEYQLSTGGSWETNEIGHLIHNGLNNIVPTGTK
ncbi:hypothetical protein PQO03_05800 [Lentisphaera profundi]|uniref:Uncharacterized protein n=1 Tax=Lentisphaera profundi TaxID=1658616 RepID=A0ABY7VSX2_9BACT|nr:hypothetical protein [Lentisphaera profundi]WDE95233.1 hypothetical protein PQO03_05800 [Lentisphaera profundi]